MEKVGVPSTLVTDSYQDPGNRYLHFYLFFLVLVKQGSKAEMAFLLNIQTLGWFYHFVSE